MNHGKIIGINSTISIKKEQEFYIHFFFFEKHIRIKLDITNIDFQNKGILLYNLKMSCLDTLYVVQKLRLNSHFSLKKKVELEFYILSHQF